MMGGTHLCTGFTVGAWTVAAASAVGIPAPVALLAGPLVAYSALLPDLDHPRSTATYSLGPLTVALSWVLCLFVDHRGPTHTPRGAAVFATVAAVGLVWLPAPVGGWSVLLWWVAVFLGCLTHVWGDARTTSGVPWGGHPWRAGMGWRVAAGRLRVGRTFDTGSAHELWRLKMIYAPVAVASWVLALWILRNG